MADNEDQAGERVWRAMPAGTRQALTRLPPADLQTLLIDVFRARAGQATPAGVMRRWQHDRFVRPAAADPRRVAAVEARLWQLLPAGFTGIELSPVAPLGTCTAVALVSQNRIVTTVRATKVVSDSTNALAVEAATRRRGQPKDGHTDLEAATRRRGQPKDGHTDLAACQRQLRAQLFGPGAAAHFRLFALVSSARDRGSGQTEAGLLIRHLAYWLDVLNALIPRRQPRIELSALDSPVLAERLADTIRPGLAEHAPFLIDKPERTRGRGYYAGFALRITEEQGGTELGDGGLTTWTAQLTQDAKERCLVSCIATERLTALAADCLRWAAWAGL